MVQFLHAKVDGGKVWEQGWDTQ